MATTAKQKKAKGGGTSSNKQKAEHKALVESFFGSMPDLKLTVDSYLREKYAETDV